MNIIQSARAAQPEASASQPAGNNPMDRVMVAASKVLYDPQMENHVIAMVRAGQNPAAGIAHAAVFVMRQLVQQSKGMPQQIVGPAAGAIAMLIAEMAQHAGIIPDAKAIASQIGKAMLQEAQQSAQQPMQGAH